MPLDKSLPLDHGVRARVFRSVCDLLEADPDLKRVIDPEGWYVLDGRHGGHTAAFGQSLMTAVRVTPFGEGAAPLTNVQQYSALTLRVEVCTPGPAVEDLLNLWEALEAAVFKGDGRGLVPALTAAAQAAKRPGQCTAVRLSQPAAAPDPSALAEGLFYAAGTLSIELTVRK